MRLALQLLTFNRLETLRALFDSLAAQTDRDWAFYNLDNSTDEAKATLIAALVEEQKGRLSIVFERSSSNIGFTGGHQHLYERHNADYVMCVNDDVILEPEYIERVCRGLDEQPKVAAVGGKILRWDFDPEGVRSGIGNLVKKTDIVDSLGLAKTRYHKVYDIGAGKKIPDSRPDPIPAIPVFGVSGCLPLYRRVAVGSQLFDPSYFMYKEDVDLAYRLAKTGWASIIVPSAVAYHRRTFSIQARKAVVPFFIQWLSYRNHWRNLGKHLAWRDWLVSGWLIIPYEVAKFGYLCYNYRTEFLNAVRKEWL